MSYIVLTRNPRSKELLAILDAQKSFRPILEFETEEQAREEADQSEACKAWGYQIVQVQVE